MSRLGHLSSKSNHGLELILQRLKRACANVMSSSLSYFGRRLAGRQISDVDPPQSPATPLITLLLAPQLPPGTRRKRHRRLEVVDRLSPQNQVLQELCFIRPGLLGTWS